MLPIDPPFTLEVPVPIAPSVLDDVTHVTQTSIAWTGIADQITPD